MTQLARPLLPGQRLARGVCRHLASLDFAPLEEFVPERGRRVDVMALGPKGEQPVMNSCTRRSSTT